MAANVLLQVNTPNFNLDTKGWWVLGICASLLACLGTTAGMLMQKYAHNIDPSPPGNKQKKKKLWWISLILMIGIPAPLDIVALALAAQSLLAPLTAVTLLLTVVLAPCFLPEKILPLDIVATILICSGAVVTTIFGAHEQKIFDVRALLELYSHAAFIVFQVFFFLIIVGILLWIRYSPDPFWYDDRAHKGRSSSQDHGHPENQTENNSTNENNTSINDNSDNHVRAPVTPRRAASSSAAPTTFVFGSISKTAYSHVPSSTPRKWWHLPHKAIPFAHATVAALTGAEQLVLTKTFAELVVLSINGWAQYTYVLFYILLILAVLFALFQIWFLSSGLERFDAIFYLSIYNALLIVFQVFCGGIYFEEFGIHGMTPATLALFFLGVAIVLAGVLVLTQRPPQHAYEKLPDDEESNDEAGDVEQDNKKD